MLNESESPGAAATATGAKVVEAGAATFSDNVNPTDGQIGLPLDFDDLSSVEEQTEGFQEGLITEEEHSRFRVYTLEEIMATTFPPRETLLEPWLPEEGIAMIFAPRGVGKTHLALACAYAVASGGTFLGWCAPASRPVLFIDGEMPITMLQERLGMIVANAAVKAQEGFFRLLPYNVLPEGGPDLSTAEGQAELEPLIGDAKLVVVDNISTVCRSGKENEAEDWAPVQAWALQQRRKGRTVLFIHHANKNGGQRGTSKREDVMDTVIMLSHPDDYRAEEGARFIIQFSKNRGFTGKDAEPFEASLWEGAWTMRNPENEREARILDLHANGLPQRTIANTVGCSAATVNRVIKSHFAKIASHEPPVAPPVLEPRDDDLGVVE